MDQQYTNFNKILESLRLVVNLKLKEKVLDPQSCGRLDENFCDLDSLIEFTDFLHQEFMACREIINQPKEYPVGNKEYGIYQDAFKRLELIEGARLYLSAKQLLLLGVEKK